jgi:hypothetical protein
MQRLIILLTLVSSLVACTVIDDSVNKQTTEKSQLQIREFQTREFDTNNSKLVLKAVLNVLQDDGFVVKNAVPDLGLLTASKEIDLNAKTDTKGEFWGDLLSAIVIASSDNNTSHHRRGDDKPQKKFKTIEVSVNVTEIGSRCKVRANFQAKETDNSGATQNVYVIEDQKFYQEFFAKVDKGVFIQKQGL